MTKAPWALAMARSRTVIGACRFVQVAPPFSDSMIRWPPTSTRAVLTVSMVSGAVGLPMARTVVQVCPPLVRLPEDGVGAGQERDGVDGLGVVGVNGDAAAAVAVHPFPGLGVGEDVGAVGLAAGHDRGGPGRVGGDAVDERDREVAVEVGPGAVGFAAPEAAVGRDQEPAPGYPASCRGCRRAGRRRRCRSRSRRCRWS